MPIVTAELPPGALDAVSDTLTGTQRFPRRRGGELSLSSPHRVFGIPLDRLAKEDRPLEAAEPIGWRALLEEDKRVVAAVELPAADAVRGGALLNRGQFVESTVTALTTAERDDRVASERFELRLLRVNALYLLALWLRAAETGTDLFIPLEPAPAPLNPDTVYESKEFEEALLEMGRAVASSYQDAERPDELGS